MSDFTPTHTWHFLGQNTPVVVLHEYDDGYGVEDEGGLPYLAHGDELTVRLTAQEAYDIAVEKMTDRARDFDS